MYNACFNPLKYKGLALSTSKSQHTTYISANMKAIPPHSLGEGDREKPEQGGVDARMNHAD